MNQIEKLYENAGIKPIDIAEYGSTYIPKKIEINGKPYPPFTAEKQIKLLEFNYKYSRVPDIGYIIELKKYDCPHYEEYGAFDTFQGALCADINYHWEYFTEEEKEQIRGILE